jgi:hypothetical protein
MRYNVMFHLLNVSFPAGSLEPCASTRGLSTTQMDVVEKMRNLIKAEVPSVVICDASDCLG